MTVLPTMDDLQDFTEIAAQQTAQQAQMRREDIIVKSVVSGSIILTFAFLNNTNIDLLSHLIQTHTLVIEYPYGRALTVNADSFTRTDPSTNNVSTSTVIGSSIGGAIFLVLLILLVIVLLLRRSRTPAKQQPIIDSDTKTNELTLISSPAEFDAIEEALKAMGVNRNPSLARRPSAIWTHDPEFWELEPASGERASDSGATASWAHDPSFWEASAARQEPNLLENKPIVSNASVSSLVPNYDSVNINEAAPQEAADLTV